VARLLEPAELDRQLVDLPGWTAGGQAISRTFQAPDFLAGVQMVVEVAQAAEEMDHHPDIDIRWRTLHLTLSTHSAGGVTQLDVELAHRIDAAATAHGAN
jgi:4a-hydroxytetrahydrobiopterin dehydratase